MGDASRGIVDDRLRALLKKGYEAQDLSTYPIDLYHRLNPARAYDPNHRLCSVMLCRDGRVLKSRYCDDWEIDASDAEAFNAFMKAVPKPTLWRLIGRRAERARPQCTQRQDA